VSQSRVDSLMESVTNVGIGFVVAVIGNALILPVVLGVKMHFSENLIIALAFTVISIIRQYVLRRLFNGRSVWQAVKTWWSESLCKTGTCAWCDFERHGR
jgi:hypothetical protein